MDKAEQFRWWFFKYLNFEQRQKLFQVAGLPVHEIRTHAEEGIGLKYVLRELARAQLPASAPSVSVDEELPVELFEGFAVFEAMSGNAKRRTSPENVSDVLDALASLMRQRAEASKAKPPVDEQLADFTRNLVASQKTLEPEFQRVITENLNSMLFDEHPSGELGKSAEQQKSVRQYYCRKNECKAHSAKDADCICWWDEGTGPFPDGTDLVTLEWRIIERKS